MKRARGMAVTAALAVAASAIAAEPPPERPVEIGFGGEQTVELVEGWPFLARGPGCEGLRAGDLRVLEDGRDVEVVAVEQAERATLHVLLLDTSASMSHPTIDPHRKRGLQTKAAAASYIEWMHADAVAHPSSAGISQPDDQLMILTFDDDLILRAPPTPVRSERDRDWLLGVVESIDGGSRTFLQDAVVRVVDYLRSLPVRSVLIVLSDGEDTGARRPADRVLRTVEEAHNVSLFTIGIDLEPGPHEELLRQLATASGGRYFSIGDKKPDRLGEHLTNRFSEIRERLKGEFYVSWKPRPLERSAPPSEPAADHLWVDVRILSARDRCRVQPESYRPLRFVRLGAEPHPTAVPERGEPQAQPRVVDDHIVLTLLDVLRDEHPMRPGEGLPPIAREVEIIVPALPPQDQRSTSTDPATATEPALAEVIRSWLLAGLLPPPTEDRHRYMAPLGSEINGKAFLDERTTIARAIFDLVPAYGDEVRAKIGERLRRTYREKLLADAGLSHERRAEIEEQIESLVAARIADPPAEDIARELSAWHRDIGARELAIAVERLQAAKWLERGEDGREEAAALEQAWSRLYDWLRPPGRVRVTTPLVLASDPVRGSFGFSRIVLPREASWPAGSVPIEPYGLQAMGWLLGGAPIAREGNAQEITLTPVSQALRGYTLQQLDHTIEPVPPTDVEQPEAAVPVERARIRFGFRGPNGDPAGLELITETRFERPANWNGLAPVAWRLGHAPLEPERFNVQCFVPGSYAASTALESALAAMDVPVCP